MRKIQYEDWADYLHAVTDKYVKRGARTLELAAGNGQLASHLKKFYPNIVITDLSKHMVKQSPENLKKIVCCDMTSLPFKGEFDLIYSVFDSVNYLTSQKLLKKLFDEVERVLSEDGIFTFDVALERNSIKHASTPIRKGKVRGINYIHTTIYNPKTRVHKNKFEIVFPGNEKYFEVHKQKIYTFDKYFDIIERTGLYVTECLEAFTFKDGRPGSLRLQFVLKRI